MGRAGGCLGRLSSDLFTNVTTGVEPMINSLLVLTGAPAGILLLPTLNMSAGVSNPKNAVDLAVANRVPAHFEFFALYRSAGNSHRFMPGGDIF